MPDPRALDRLLDPAAFARAAVSLDPAEVAESLRPFLDATQPELFAPLAEELPDEALISWPAIEGPEPGPAPVASAAEAVTPASAARPDLALILLPAIAPIATPLHPDLRSEAKVDIQHQVDGLTRSIECLIPASAATPDSWPPACAAGWVGAASPASSFNLDGPAKAPQPVRAQAPAEALAEAWCPGPSLIEPAALWPAAGTPPSQAESASRPGPTPSTTVLVGAGSAGATRTDPAWPAAAMPPGPASAPTAVPPLASAAGATWDEPSGEGLSSLVPRLLQAADRLEAAAEQLARQAIRWPATTPAPRPFRGRVAD
jgi:hypothetical protein